MAEREINFLEDIEKVRANTMETIPIVKLMDVCRISLPSCRHGQHVGLILEKLGENLLEWYSNTSENVGIKNATEITIQIFQLNYIDE